MRNNLAFHPMQTDNIYDIEINIRNSNDYLNKVISLEKSDSFEIIDDNNKTINSSKMYFQIKPTIEKGNIMMKFDIDGSTYFKKDYISNKDFDHYEAPLKKDDITITTQLEKYNVINTEVFGKPIKLGWLGSWLEFFLQALCPV